VTKELDIEAWDIFLEDLSVSLMAFIENCNAHHSSDIRRLANGGLEWALQAHVSSDQYNCIQRPRVSNYSQSPLDLQFCA
jgi:hypothetical protein